MDTDTPVLIAGAGPAGLAAAVELTRRDIPVLLVERRTALSPHPRATVLSLRSMELVRSWGLETEVRARSADVDPRMLEADTLAAPGTAIEVGYPTAEQSRMVSPVQVACIAQDELEPLLLDQLLAAPGARVRLGVELTGLWAGPDGARAELRDVRTGAMSAVHARYVVAADGASSAARRALGIPMIGPGELMAGATTLIRAPLWDVVGERRHLLYNITNAESPSVLLPTGASDRWLFAAVDEEEPTAARTATLVRTAAGVPDLPVRVVGVSRWSAGAQVAERWRSGAVLLAGDAAHRVTPRGGTGLNLALHDGYDLGWKLAWALRGWGAPGLVDSYEAERRPVAEYTAERSADPMGSRRTPEGEVRADLGGRIAHVWAGERSTLDLLGPGLTLFAGSRRRRLGGRGAGAARGRAGDGAAAGPGRRARRRRARRLRAAGAARRPAGGRAPDAGGARLPLTWEGCRGSHSSARGRRSSPAT